MSRILAALASAGVSCAAYAAPPSGPVSALIVNPIDAPVPVRVADEPVNICGPAQTGFPNQALYEVPAGHRLQIVFASVKTSRFLEESESVTVILGTTVDGIQGSFFVGRPAGVNGSVDSKSVTLFADPGTTVTTSQGYSGSGSGALPTSTVCLAGLLIPI